MRVIYDAANTVDAHLVKHALDEAGIPAFIRGEYLTGAMGELPMTGLVQVCVPSAAWPEARDCLLALGLISATDEDRDDPAIDGLLA
ncbi:DUF2007 domain-containing protein [Arenimonas oryziterrae]|uniref:DUF2007 domain-containing protein n=1 Tax=Arenimonas oryziterrae DSM 21050 = YC6267 TaxID=1121015 RepID=A0A091AT44_9GAMM|nr:DUF2007 domain-containing protein [Arenimonas oryziterrae]KFN43368.1 hypothetical protein N789_08825 [Arenimonas oryziterrae DSM 21050 = YC6267]